MKGKGKGKGTNRQVQELERATEYESESEAWSSSRPYQTYLYAKHQRRGPGNDMTCSLDANLQCGYPRFSRLHQDSVSHLGTPPGIDYADAARYNVAAKRACGVPYVPPESNIAGADSHG
ncbi:hypothetical protein LTR28_010571 [Elasticomyces elasticus]|nr:hypothetical protein LTR28_010571 [Elasticomyces elasticus]